MRYLTAFLLLTLLALPAFGTVADNGDGTASLTLKAPNHKYIAACVGLTGGNRERLGAWLDGTLLCNDSGVDAVALGICSQQESDDGVPWPTATCAANHVTNGICLTEWLGLKIPKPASCQKFVDFMYKQHGRSFSSNGAAALELSRSPEAAVPGGDWGDQ